MIFFENEIPLNKIFNIIILFSLLKTIIYNQKLLFVDENKEI